MREKATIAAVLLVLGIALLGIAMRLYILWMPVNPDWDSAHRYIPLARSIAGRGEFSAEPGVPDTFDQPVYPLILAFFREHWKNVVAFQLCLELAIIAAVWHIAKSLGGSPVIAACMMWVCPTFPWWASFIDTELTATTFSALLLLTLIRKKWAWSGVLAALCVLTRGDMLPAVLLMFAAAIVAHRPPRKPVVIGSVFLLATILPWCIRTYRVAGTFNFVSGVSAQAKEPFVQWMDLWADNEAYVEQYWWVRPAFFPPEVLPDPNERRQALDATAGAVRPQVLDPEQQNVFRQLAQRRWHEHWLRSLIGTRIQRPFVAWATIVPGARNRIPLAAGGIVVLALSLFALGGFDWAMPRRLLLIPGALLLGRSALPFVSVLGAEPRYLVEALPAALPLCSIAICRLLAPGGIFSCSAGARSDLQPLTSTSR